MSPLVLPAPSQRSGGRRQEGRREAKQLRDGPCSQAHVLSQASRLGTAEESAALARLPSAGRGTLIGRADTAGERLGRCLR